MLSLATMAQAAIMARDIVKILDKTFSDMKAGERMYIASPQLVAHYIAQIPKGETRTPKQMRFDLAHEKGADNSCPVSTGIFLRMAIEEALNPASLEDTPLPFWRLVDEAHPVLKKLAIPADIITKMRALEAG